MRLSLVVLDIGKPVDQALLYLTTAHDHLSARRENSLGVCSLRYVRSHHLGIRPVPTRQAQKRPNKLREKIVG